MRYDIVDKDVRYKRDECPPTCSSVTGTFWGSVCRCGCEPEAPVVPAPPSPRCCSVRVTSNNLRRYRISNGSGAVTVCC